LILTKDKGLILDPKDHSFDCWVDADFVGNWDRVNANIDPSTAKSRTGYIVSYAGCPISWASKLQTEVALSTTEAEYNALSASLRETIHLMQVVEEAKILGWEIFMGKPTVHCTVFEDNSGALEMARLPKMRPRTKHLCVRLHHFRERVRNGSISIQHVPSEKQLADMLTKPQPEALFALQRESVLNWKSEYDNAKYDGHLLPDHLRACDIPMSGDGVGQHDPGITSDHLRNIATKEDESRSNPIPNDECFERSSKPPDEPEFSGITKFRDPSCKQEWKTVGHRKKTAKYRGSKDPRLSVQGEVETPGVGIYKVKKVPKERTILRNRVERSGLSESKFEVRKDVEHRNLQSRLTII
jgi:hypothetical protein